MSYTHPDYEPPPPGNFARGCLVALGLQVLLGGLVVGLLVLWQGGW